MKIIIAGGGTGGHLFPGIAIAEEFMSRDKKSRMLFIGTNYGIEKSVIPREGYTLKTITIEGFKGRKLIKSCMALLKIPISIIQSIAIFAQYRPDIVIGVGGYASLSPLITSSILGIPSVIHEQNRTPGLTTKILARFVKKIFVSFEESPEYFSQKNITVTGNPVRKRLIKSFEIEKKENDKFIVFIFGGSQGASSINNAMVKAMEYLADLKNSIHIIHQTGKKDVDYIKEEYQKKGFSADVSSFIENMSHCYKQADIVICRSGATTLAELTACGKASLLIPFPFATGNHQEINARALLKKGAADMVLDKDLNGKTLAEKIRLYSTDKKKISEMEENSKKMSRIDAAEKIVDACYELVGMDEKI